MQKKKTASDPSLVFLSNTLIHTAGGNMEIPDVRLKQMLAFLVLTQSRCIIIDYSVALISDTENQDD